ncbi:Emopamil-binding protein, partial [Martensiomyces pterosporus]
HPYYPESLVLDGYVEPTQSPLQLVLAIGGALALVLLASYALLFARKASPRLRPSERAVCMWFVLCGSLHCVFELHYLLHFTTIQASTDLLSSMWKEYAKSDSRYLAQVPLVFALESITVCFVGPLCWLTVHHIHTNAPLRHVCQLAVSLLHVYSVVLYYGTEFVSAESSCRPEPLYYYGYFIAMNAPWLVVPLCLAIASARELCRGMAAARRAT